MRRAALLAAWLCYWAPVAADAATEVACRDITFEANHYTLCAVDAEKADLRLFLYDADGAAFGHFGDIGDALDANGEALAFAMNGGMYHADRAPVGHYVENGQVLMDVVPNAGPGNFGMLPNGVFCIGAGRADVVETLKFIDTGKRCRFATQSGPMLVIDGQIHPRFLPDSTSRYRRNGVGTTADGRHAVFAISDNAVTFHEFARLFRDALGLSNALYFDGNISRLYAPELGRDDPGRAMGPVVGVVVPEN